MTEEELIEGYKKDFKNKTGKPIKVFIGNRFETICYIPHEASCNEMFINICEAMEWDPSLLRGRSRKSESVLRRWLVFLVLYSNDFSLYRIGKVLKKDHTAVMHGISKIKERLENDLLLLKLLKEVVQNVITGFENVEMASDSLMIS